MKPANNLAGQSIKAVQFNQLNAHSKAGRMLPGVGQRYMRTPRGTMPLDPGMRVSAGGTTQVKMFQLYLVYDEYLIAFERSASGQVGTALNYIALPDELRTHPTRQAQRTFLNETHNYFYEAVGGDSYNKIRFDSPSANPADPAGEHQLIYRPWHVNEIIWAVKASTDVEYGTNLKCPWVYFLPHKMWAKRYEGG